MSRITQHSPRSHAPPRYQAFTLVELLVVVSIIAVLSATLAFAMVGASERARVTRTRAMIVKLNNIVMRRYESYRTRRVLLKINPDDTYVDLDNNHAYSGANELQFDYNQDGAYNALSGAQRAKLRLYGLREMMRYELPDNFNDFADVVNGYKFRPPLVLQTVPSVANAYFQTLNAAHNANTSLDLAPNQGAECLYMICTCGCVDESGDRVKFSDHEVADTDGDGLPEFIDGWGKPIAFVRWPAGFLSDLESGKDPDPFDPMGVDWNATNPTQNRFKPHATAPLIFSTGPDSVAGLMTVSPLFKWPPSNFSGNNAQELGPNDPYVINTQNCLRGAAYEEDSSGNPIANPVAQKDNIDNHLIGAR